MAEPRENSIMVTNIAMAIIFITRAFLFLFVVLNIFLLFTLLNYSNFCVKLASMLTKLFKSKFTAILFLALGLYLLILNYRNISFMLELQNRAEQAQEKYKKIEKERQDKLADMQDSQTDMAKERYEKEFFNKTEEGETVVILHKKIDKKENESEEELLQLNFVDRKIQQITLWWKNL
jgi:predicted signal transduction protein with EAL and GGDEF domain